MPFDFGAGVIGTGFMGAAHARSIRASGARLVGVAGSTPLRAKEAAVRLGADRSFASAEDLIADTSIDVVHVCTPNDLHSPMALAALAAGKHVVCEKPLGTGVDQARAMVTALTAAGTVGAVPFVYRFHPMVREFRARVRAGELGRLHVAHGAYLQDWLSSSLDTDWRVDPATGGPSRAFADIGSHWFDLVEFLTDDPVVRLSARFATVHGGRGTEDLATIQFETAGGMLGSAIVSQVAQGHKNGLVIEVNGSAASARFDQEQPGSLWVGRRVGVTILSPDPRLLAADAARTVVVPPGHPQGYLDCMDRFVLDTYHAIIDVAPDGLPTFADGLRAAEIVDTACRSAAADGTWTGVAP